VRRKRRRAAGDLTEKGKRRSAQRKAAAVLPRRKVFVFCVHLQGKGRRSKLADKADLEGKRRVLSDTKERESRLSPERTFSC